MIAYWHGDVIKQDYILKHTKNQRGEVEAKHSWPGERKDERLLTHTKNQRGEVEVKLNIIWPGERTDERRWRIKKESSEKNLDKLIMSTESMR